jgi:hypothetical protein
VNHRSTVSLIVIQEGDATMSNRTTGFKVSGVFIDLVKLVAERLPILNNLIVELAVIGLLVYAVYTIFHRDP